MSKGDTTLEVQNETSIEYTPHAAIASSWCLQDCQQLEAATFQLVLAGLPAMGNWLKAWK